MKQSILVAVDHETNRILQDVQNGIYEGMRDVMQQVKNDILISLEENHDGVKASIDGVNRTMKNCQGDIQDITNIVGRLSTSAELADSLKRANQYINEKTLQLEEHVTKVETMVADTVERVDNITINLTEAFDKILDAQQIHFRASQCQLEEEMIVQKKRQEEMAAELKATHCLVAELQAELKRDLTYLRKPWYKRIW